jgi:hypothetical protein
MSLLNQTRRTFAKLLTASSTTTRTVAASTSLFAQRRAYGVTAPGSDIPKDSSPLKAKEPPFAKERRELEENEKQQHDKKIQDMKTGPIKPPKKDKKDEPFPKPASV